MAKVKIGRAGQRLVAHRDHPEDDRALSVSEAASRLARRFVRKYGKEHLIELARRGGVSAWRGTTAQERVLEMRRRAVVRRRNKAARILAAIKAGPGR